MRPSPSAPASASPGRAGRPRTAETPGRDLVLLPPAQSAEPWRPRARSHPAGPAPPTPCVLPGGVGPPLPQPEGNCGRPGCACSVARWAGREARRPRSRAAPRAGCRSYAVGARRRGRPSRGGLLSFLRCRKEIAPVLARRREVLAPVARCAGVGEAPLRQGRAPSPGAGPRRHGLVGAGAGRRAVRPAGGAARPRRSLCRGGVLLQGEPRAAGPVEEAEGRRPGPRRPVRPDPAFPLFLLARSSAGGGRAVEAGPRAPRPPGLCRRGRSGCSLGRQCPRVSCSWRQWLGLGSYSLANPVAWS